MADRIVVGATNSVTLKGLKNTDDNSYPIDADVELEAFYELTDGVEGSAVTGTEGIPMPYIEGVGRSSIYRGAVPHTATFAVGATYRRRVVATDADGNVRAFNADLVAEQG